MPSPGRATWWQARSPVCRNGPRPSPSPPRRDHGSAAPSRIRSAPMSPSLCLTATRATLPSNWIGLVSGNAMELAPIAIWAFETLEDEHRIALHQGAAPPHCRNSRARHSKLGPCQVVGPWRCRLHANIQRLLRSPEASGPEPALHPVAKHRGHAPLCAMPRAPTTNGE